MPKKSKATKKTAKTEAVVEEVPEELRELSEDQLKEKVALLKSNLLKASNDRNFMALEKDAVTR